MLNAVISALQFLVAPIITRKGDLFDFHMRLPIDKIKTEGQGGGGANLRA